MAAKSPAAKKTKTAKSVKTSKTTKSKSNYTSVQQKAYNAAYNAAVKAANQGARENAIAAKRARHAEARAVSREKYITRTKARIVRNTYLQATYGRQVQQHVGVPLRSQLRTAQSVLAYLQVRYGKKTYALTTGQGSVRVKPRVVKGRVVAAGKRAVSKAATTRSAQAQGRAAAARYSKAAQPKSRQRTAAGRRKTLAHTQWITAGNDEGEKNCVAVALANHLLYHTGRRVSDAQVEYLNILARRRVSTALDQLDYYEAWAPVSLSEYGSVKPEDAKPGMLVGFETPEGDHCGVLMPGNMVVSWGEIVPLESEIEEAWEITWATD